MAIKRNLIVTVETNDHQGSLSLRLEAGAQLVYLSIDDNRQKTTAITLTQEAIFELREGLTAILDAIKDNAAGR